MNQEIFTDSQLDEAATQAMDAMLEHLPPPSQCQHTFSPEFEAQMRKVCARDKRRRALRACSRRVAMIALTCLACFSTFLALNTEARAAVQRWFRTQYESQLSYAFSGELEPDFPALLPVARFRPQYLPEGYEEDGWSASGSQVVVEYVKESSELLSFGYIPEARALSPADWDQDENGTTHIQVTVNGESAALYLPADETAAPFLLWDDPGLDTAFYLSADLSEQELLRIAESIHIANRSELPPIPPGQAPVFEPLYQLAYVPDGYVLDKCFGDETSCNTIYRDPKSGSYFGFDVFYIHSGFGMSVSMDEDKYEYQPIQINGMSGEYYRALDENAHSFLMWVDEDADLAFTLSGRVDENELLQTAKSVTRNG